MIIIKSQDGLTITEAHTIYTVETDNGLFIKCNDGTMLGRYKDKDRAKEVMRIIDDHIRESYVIKMYVRLASFEAGTDSIQEVMETLQGNMSKLAIFEMPKE